MHFKLQNVNVVLKMAVIFIIVADTYTILFITVFVTFLRYDKFLWRVQFISSRSPLHLTQIPRETENSLSYWGFVVRTLLIINKESCFYPSWVVFLIINLFIIFKHKETRCRILNSTLCRFPISFSLFLNFSKDGLKLGSSFQHFVIMSYLKERAKVV